MANKSTKIKSLQVSALVLIFYLFQRAVDRIGWKIAFIFNYSAIDADGIFMPVSIHHIAMAFLTLIVILSLNKTKGLDFKIRPRIDKIGIKYTAMYCAAMLIYIMVEYFICIRSTAVSVYDYPLSPANVAGVLAFQLLLSGTAEELLFRALPLVCLCAVCCESKNSINAFMIFLTALLFAIAHINFNISLSAQWYSILYAFIHGIIFAFVFLRSKSVIYPMIMHGIGNSISVGATYLYMAIYLGA